MPFKMSISTSPMAPDIFGVPMSSACRIMVSDGRRVIMLFESFSDVLHLQVLLEKWRGNKFQKSRWEVESDDIFSLRGYFSKLEVKINCFNHCSM